MVLFCAVCTKRLKLIHVNNFSLKKCEKNVTNVRKRETMERFPSYVFQHVNNDREDFALSLFTFTNQN